MGTALFGASPGLAQPCKTQVSTSGCSRWRRGLSASCLVFPTPPWSGDLTLLAKILPRPSRGDIPHTQGTPPWLLFLIW